MGTQFDYREPDLRLELLKVAKNTEMIHVQSALLKVGDDFFFVVHSSVGRRDNSKVPTIAEGQCFDVSVCANVNTSKYI